MSFIRNLRRRYFFRRIVVYLLICCMFFNMHMPVAWAGPEGAEIVNGQVSIEQSGYNTVITASDRSIINYSGFDILKPEVVEFVQPGSSASVLNRILSANPTHIDGTLLANGRVFFVNPAGVYFGEGARVNVNQLVASALNISNFDFINGRYNFTEGNGSVVNLGDISAEKVYLIGNQVVNSGTISCPAGYVVMAAGERIFLSEQGSEILLEVELPALSEVTDPIDSGPGVLNEGNIEAPSGQIVLAAAGDMYSQAISNVGSLSVSTDIGDGGQIKLVSPDGQITNNGSIEAKSGGITVDGSNIRNSGIIDASSATVGVDGGNITISGESISNKGTIKANSEDYAKAGNINVTTEHVLTLEETSLIEARGKDIDSSGGNIYLYSYGDAYAKDGQIIDISGGETSGDGGRGELSALRNVSMAGTVLGYAAKGYKTGQFIIDPLNASVSGTYVADTTVWAEDNITIDGATTIDVSGSGITLSLFADHLSATGGDWDDGTGAGGGTAGTGTITRTGDYTIAKSGSNTATLVMKAADDGSGSGGIGTSGTPIKTNVDILGVETRSTSSGSVYISEADTLDISTSTVAGDMGVTATTGDITDSGVVTVGGTGSFTTSNANDDIDLGTLAVTGAIDVHTSGATGNAMIVNATGVDLSASNVGGDLGVTATTGDVTISAGVTTNGGSFTSSGVNFDNTGGIVSTGGGAIAINHSGTVTLGAQLNPGGGTISGASTSITVASNAASIQDGIDVSAAGATVTVADDTYTEDLNINKELTLKSETGRDNTTIQLVDGVGIDIGSGGTGFTLGGSSSNGFTILGGSATTFDIQLANGPSGVEVSWNTINTTGNASMGINVGAAGATGLNVNNNIFTADTSDDCIWGGAPVTNLQINDNVFSGPGIGVSSYAMEFRGVAETTASTIEDNTVNGFNYGIAIFNGTSATPTDGLDILHNNVENCTIGIWLRQYPGDDGILQNVNVHANTLIGNTTGLEIMDTDVQASTISIMRNSFTGNTTALANKHTSQDITATENYWGAEDGPSGIGPGSGDPITEVVADSVDYSPWWGGDYVDDSHTTPWIWGTNDYIQDAIDLASITVTDSIYITADTYTETVNVNKQIASLYFIGDGTVTSEIDGTLTLSDDVASNTGVDIYTQNNGDLILNAVLDPGTHSLKINTEDGTTNLDDNITVGNDLTLESNTTVAAGKKLLAANNFAIDDGDKLTGNGALTIEATTGTATFGGEVETAGTLDVTGSAIAAKDNMTTATGDMRLHGPTTVHADKKLLAAGNLQLGAGTTLTAQGDLGLEAKNGGITEEPGDDDRVQVNMAADGKTLWLKQENTIDMAGFAVTNSHQTNLVAQSIGGSVAMGPADDNPPDKWKSIAATAEGGTTLEGSGDITTNALTSKTNNISIHSTGGDLIVNDSITAELGGASLIADNPEGNVGKGRIYTPGGADDTLDVAITGFSDGTTGVDLPAGSGKAAIVIQSKDALKLGENCNLTAEGSYLPSLDERQDVIFDLDGDPIDIAIYAASFDSVSGTGGNVDVGSSRISVNNSDGEGTVVIDAYDTVTFTDNFENSLKLNGLSDIMRIEAASRISPDLQTAINLGTLPHADNPASIADGEYVLSGGVYVLRGPENLLAKAEILALTGPVALVPPVPLELEDRGEVEEANKEALLEWLAEELGQTTVQAYLAKAWPPSLNTDLRPYKAAARLQNYAAVLKDTEGAHITALTQVVDEFIATPVPPSEEQMALIASSLREHTGDGTHYALAGLWINAVVEYVSTLNTEIGWSPEKSVAFVMDKYGSRLTEGGDIRAAMFVQMYMEESFGG